MLRNLRDLFLVVALFVFSFVGGAWSACHWVDRSSPSACNSYDINTVNSVCADKACVYDIPTFGVPESRIVQKCWNIDRVPCTAGNPGHGYHCGNWDGRNGYVSAWPRVYYCETDAEAEEARKQFCKDNPQLDGCALPDTTYTCQSVFTENNVVRSEIQMKIDGTDSGESRLVLGSCTENGFCEGEGKDGLDSCSYHFDGNNCRTGGQDGSMCTYVCADGRLHSCRQSIASPINIPPCPQKPWRACVDSIGKPKPKYDPQQYTPVSDTSSHDSAPDVPSTPDDYTEVLTAILDTLHHANFQRKEQMYVQEKIYDNIAGYGEFSGDGIYDRIGSVVGNTATINTTLNRTNSAINTVASRLNDTLLVAVANFPEPDDTPIDSTIRFNYDYSYVARIDTNTEDIKGTIDEINRSLDTLVNDTPRTVTILRQYLPRVSDMVDALERIANGDVFLEPVTKAIRAQTDSIMNRMESLMSVDLDAIDSAIDSVDLDYDWGDTSIDYIIPVEPLPDVPHWRDSAQYKDFYDRIDAQYDSLAAIAEKPQKVDSLPLKELQGDSAAIRNKLSRVFLLVETREECFDFDLNTTLGKWTYRLYINFGDMFGLDLCGFIRMVVRLFTFIAIVFTTVKGFIRAFGGTSGSAED